MSTIEIDIHALVNKAVSEVQQVMGVYPQRFRSIEEVKRYIAHACDYHRYTYGIPNYAQKHTAKGIRDKVQFLVAMHAHKDGEFYLDISPPREGEYKRMVKDDAKRIEALLPTWPSWFDSVKDANDHIKRVCYTAEFAYSRYASMPEWRYQNSVNIHVAREAYLDGKFVTKQPFLGQDGRPLVPKSAAKEGVAARKPASQVDEATPVAGAATTRNSSLSIGSGETTVDTDLSSASDTSGQTWSVLGGGEDRSTHAATHIQGQNQYKSDSKNEVIPLLIDLSDDLSPPASAPAEGHPADAVKDDLEGTTAESDECHHEHAVQEDTNDPVSPTDGCLPEHTKKDVTENTSPLPDGCPQVPTVKEDDDPFKSLLDDFRRSFNLQAALN